MPTRLNPYLNFRDNAREAMEFYHSVLGGELTVSSFGDYQMAQDPSEANKIMHGQLDAPNGMTLMGADTPASMPYGGGANGSISLSGQDEAELRGYWTKLVEGGQVTVPLEPAPWGDIFGMCTDRFGVNWLVNITATRS